MAQGRRRSAKRLSRRPVAARKAPARPNAALREAIERQAATAEILRIISKSPDDTKPVFEAIVQSGLRLFPGAAIFVALPDGDTVRAAALAEPNPARAEAWRRRFPFPLTHEYMHGIAILDSKTVDFPDVAKAPVELAVGAKNFLASGYRAITIMPMLREGRAIGALSVVRLKPGPLSTGQLDVLKTFADQAVIAVENTRLVNELRQRTAELSQALEQQTATSEVLNVISRSPGELEPVFQTMLENAVKLCEAKFGTLYRYDGEACFPAAMVNAPPAYAELVWARGRFLPQAGNALDRVLKTRQLVYSVDVAAEQVPTPSARLAGARSQIIVPMLNENEMIGAIAIFKQEVRPFSDKQIALLTNFAAQAVIAVENTRLLKELRERTDDLTESLERQTAAREVLEVISSSPGALEPVFNAMLEKAVRICEAKFGNFLLYDGKDFRIAARISSAPASWIEAQRDPVTRPGPSAPIWRLVATKQIQHIHDARLEQAYQEKDPSFVTLVEVAGVRTLLIVPLMREGEVIGAIGVHRQEVQPFSDKQIELIGNFAAQAVIAIENTRLLNELRQMNEQLETRVSDQVAEIERMSRLRRFLPPQVADLIVSSGTERQLESHRREITALFCDLRGFTGFSETADPEDVMALLHEYHTAIGRIIFRHGGTLERFVGDGVMVIFNDPIPLPNPSLHAVQMALEMREAIGALVDAWRKLGHDIGFGIGISHGYATLGTIGFEGRFDYAAIGTVSNVASRLCDEAKSGQILISARVLAAVEDHVTVEDAGELALKGIKRPMPVYNVIGSRRESDAVPP